MLASWSSTLRQAVCVGSGFSGFWFFGLRGFNGLGFRELGLFHLKCLGF